MLPFGKDKAIKERDNWLKKREALSNQHSEIFSQHLHQKHIASTKESESFQLRYDALRMANLKSEYPGGLPTLRKVCDKLQWEIKQAEWARDNRRAWSININECKQIFNKLNTLLQQQDLAIKNAERLEPQIEVAHERLEEHEADKPPASHAMLASYDKEIEALSKEWQRITDAISKQSTDNEATQHAEREVTAAQEKLDALEAAAALGESSDDEQQKASGALTRARNKLESLKNAKAQREAAKRGLNRKLEEIEQERSKLADERAEVATEVYLDDLAAAEQQLWDMLNHADLHALVKKINDTRELHNLAFRHGNGEAEHIARQGPFEPLKVEMEVKHFIAHEAAKKLSQETIRI
ncbi:hypothetical protein GLV89_14595 [Halomonas alkaliantarctica]|nr:hypothetical protein [Halomonas alkaliantarctica]